MSESHEATFFWPYVGPHSVAVKGSFDNWKTAIPLHRTPHGFEAHVPVEWGKSVQYKYIVDGVWATAADKPTEFDSRGNENNVYHAPIAPAKVEETRVVTTSDLPPAHPEVVPAPPADAISPTPDPLPDKPVADGPKPITLEKVKDVITSEGTSASPSVASRLGGVIQPLTAVDPINPPQLPADVHTHSPVRFSRQSEDLAPSPAAPAIVTPPLVDVVTKPIVAVPDTLDNVKALSDSPIVEAVPKPIVAVPPEPEYEPAPIVAAPVVPEIKAADEPPKEPEVPKSAEEPHKEPGEAPKPVEEPPYVPEPPKPVEEAPKAPEVPKPVEEAPKVVQDPKPAEEPQVPEPPKPVVEEPPKVPEDPQEPAPQVVVDPPAPATPKGPPAPIDVPPADATFPTIPSPKNPEPTTPTKPSRASETNGTLASVKSRESVSKSPFGTKRGSFLGRQSSESPSKASIGSGKERKRKSSFIVKIKHILHLDGDKDKAKDTVKEKK